MKNDRIFQRVEQLTGMFPNIQRNGLRNPICA